MLYELNANFFDASMVALRTDPTAWNILRGVAVNPLEDPHVTLVYMPDLEKDEVPRVREAIKEVAATWAPFEVVAESIGTFQGAEHEGKVPHVVKLKKQPLVQLHEQLKKALQAVRPTLVDTKFKVFKPHTTLQWVPADTPIPELPEPISWEAQEMKLYFKGHTPEAFPFMQHDDSRAGPDEAFLAVVGKVARAGKAEDALRLLKAGLNKVI
jgi:2'-5' RNA ligase